MCDLGASINLMPLSIFRKLGLGEARPTTVLLQLADRSVKHPRGIIEDVDKFIFPADFIMVDMEEDKEIPIILGRPFLATGRALIDVQKGELRLRVHEEEVTFSVFNAIKYPGVSDTCFRIDALDALVSEHLGQPKEPLELSLVYPHPSLVKDEEVIEFVNWLDSFGPNNWRYFEDLGTGPSKPLPSIEKPLVLKLKHLLDHLHYAFLGES